MIDPNHPIHKLPPNYGKQHSYWTVLIVVIAIAAGALGLMMDVAAVSGVLGHGR